jgi:hypothetical protein
MFYDADHPDVLLSEWQRFARRPPHLIAEVIDRSDVTLPDWFLPLARGVAIASDALLRVAGHRPGMSRPRGWLKMGHTFLGMTRDTPRGLQNLRVWECSKPRLWTVERFSESRPYARSDEVLVHELGSTPIFMRSYQSAMRLAMHCHANGPPAELRWIAACPKDYQVAADKRRIDEALARRNAHQGDHLH